MHEVRIYDSSGKLKKIVSAQTLKDRVDLPTSFRTVYKRSGKTTLKAPVKKLKKGA